MSKLSNEELVDKAAIATDALAAQGKLNPAQSDRFIDYIVDESVLKNNARVVRFRNESLEIDKIGIGRRLAMPKAEAKDPGLRRGVTTSKVTLTPSTWMVPFEISDEFREINIEGDQIEDTIIRLMATQTSNDLEELYVTGNKLGPARLESDMIGDGGGSTTLYVKDNYIALQDGWNLLADSGHVVDAGGVNVGVSIFSLALRNMPTKFRRNRGNLRWYMSPDLIQIYQEKLATRATAAGDAAITGTSVPGPFGIPMVGVPAMQFLQPTTEHVVLTGTTPTALKSKNVSGVVITPSTLANVPTAAFIVSTDYSVDAANGTITRVGSGISSGATVKVTYLAAPRIILTHQNNFIVGIGRDVRIEKDRDIFKGVNQYAITGKVAVQYEEVDAIVTVKNLGTGV